MRIDYTNPFTSRHTLEAGAKLQMQRSDGNAYPLYGTEYDNMAVAEDERGGNDAVSGHIRALRFIYRNFRQLFRPGRSALGIHSYGS